MATAPGTPTTPQKFLAGVKREEALDQLRHEKTRMSFRLMIRMVALVSAAALFGCGGHGGSHFAYVTLIGNNTVAGLKVSEESGGLSSIPGSPFTTGNSPWSVLIHPSNKFVYVSNSMDNTISLFSVGNSGALIEVTPRTPSCIFPTFMTMDSAGNFLYVANFDSNTISVYSLNSGSGALAEIAGSPFFSQFPEVLALSPSGGVLYVVNNLFGEISAYSVNSGVLTPVAGSPFTAAPPGGLGSIAIDPSGKFLFANRNFGGPFHFVGDVLGFTVTAGTGALTLMAGTPFTAGTSPSSLTFDNSGKFLYVANFISNNVSAFTVDSNNGTPTQITGSPYTVGTDPAIIAADSSGKYLYVVHDPGTISEFVIDATAGTLKPTSQSSFNLGTNPEAMTISK
jgi:6-phosphogluconolactonase